MITARALGSRGKRCSSPLASGLRMNASSQARKKIMITSEKKA